MTHGRRTLLRSLGGTPPSRGSTCPARWGIIHRPGRHSGRRGAIIIIVALCLVVLLLFAGMTINMGVMWTTSQRAQDAADAAALAAAADLPDADAARTQVAQMVAAINEGQTHQITVDTATDVTLYHSGDTIDGYGVLEADAEAVEVRCHAPTPYLFLRVLGLDTANLTCRAVARQLTSDLVLPFIFAHASGTSQTGVTINGSGMTVDGDIHSNTRVVINGSSQTVNGTVEWRNRLTVNGSSNYIAHDAEGEIEDYPVDLTYDHFLAYCTQTVSSITLNGSGQTAPIGFIHVTGNVVFNGSKMTAQDSIYVVDGSITINGSGHQLTNCTFIARGNITANGTCLDFATPYTDGTLFFSTGGSIVANGSGEKSEGMIYAPTGQITYNGSDQCLRDGSLLAETIVINGSGFTANGTTVTGGGGVSVSLIY